MTEDKNNYLGNIFLETTIIRFSNVKELGDKTLDQLTEEELAWRINEETNSIAVIIQHMAGSTRSRWTDFLTTDGEKPDRNRDSEFIEPKVVDRDKLLKTWEGGWSILFDTLNDLKPGDLSTEVFIRGQSLTALNAILWQLSHCAYHVGQMVHIAREQLSARWKTLSIPRGESSNYIPDKSD